MNKKDKIERTPVPEDEVQCYSMMIHLLARKLGIDQISEVYHYVEMLIDACTRHSFEQQNPVSPRRKIEKNKRTFITIFHARYLQLTDFEYGRPITGIDAKMIKQVTKSLADKGFEVDDYLRWIFEAFLSENQKFCPPSLKWTCSGFALEAFFYEHRDKMKELRERGIHQREGFALINRARALMRQADEDKKQQEKEKIKKIMLAYRDQRIMLGEFRQKIEEMERQSEGSAQADQKESTNG